MSSSVASVAWLVVRRFMWNTVAAVGGGALLWTVTKSAAYVPLAVLVLWVAWNAYDLGKLVVALRLQLTAQRMARERIEYRDNS